MTANHDADPMPDDPERYRLRGQLDDRQRTDVEALAGQRLRARQRRHVRRRPPRRPQGRGMTPARAPMETSRRKAVISPGAGTVRPPGARHAP